jgi:5-methylcytosine-specific restriction protein A
MINDTRLEPGGAYLLTWNPKNYSMSLANEARLFQAGRSTIDQWSVGNTKKVQVGVPFLLIRQGKVAPGIIGWGKVRSQRFLGQHWRDQRLSGEETANYVKIELEALLAGTAISRDELRSNRVTRDHHWDALASGTRVPATVASEVWRMLKRRRMITKPIQAERQPIQWITGHFLEGQERLTVMTTRERSRGAREQCIRHHGCRCQGCGFDFGRFYGHELDGMIEVHHLQPLAQSRGPRRPDPTKDLVPLCANCHRAIHAKRPVPFSLRELRRMVGHNGEFRIGGHAFRQMTR